ncbi:MAG TPA: DUF2854 domain-containing protein [Leptolyngbyaceae cyanobacterium M33_DOE_097]|uniref:DUF2854 domain-containing protein n=1 Tax=Oscillatoriales cyanobacterium SpSt-418 TaxID=2282169 RepID=A0A7C3PJY0_9CYAN|nr:DUF2854 domain-containing protein [Leptolyngbyaceae cyanobacterium M33_DOE_097]
MLRQISLGSLGMTVGGVITIIGFAAYFSGNATLNLAGFFYGIPLLLGGFALKAAELKPTPYTEQPTEALVALRDRQATATQNQIRKDVTRYRYGQEAHLDSTLSHLGLSPTDEERPLLKGIREISTDGAYTLVLEFDSPMIPFEIWQQKQEKMTNFFGPNVEVQLHQPKDEQVDVLLVSTVGKTVAAA